MPKRAIEEEDDMQPKTSALKNPARVYTGALLGSFTAPRNRTVPDESSTTMKRKGRSNKISGAGGGMEVTLMTNAVTAAASVPFSSTWINTCKAP